MSLIDCPECVQDVSERADSCPHCGYPFQQSDLDGEAGVVLTDIDIGFNSWARILLKAGLRQFL
jgi:acetyl-CoA carboxylase carboxyltransferase subunit alpha